MFLIELQIFFRTSIGVLPNLSRAETVEDAGVSNRFGCRTMASLRGRA